MDTATCEITVKIQGGQVVAHREEGSDFETTTAIAGVAVRAVEDYLRDQLPPPKRRCRHKPIPARCDKNLCRRLANVAHFNILQAPAADEKKSKTS